MGENKKPGEQDKKIGKLTPEDLIYGDVPYDPRRSKPGERPGNIPGDIHDADKPLNEKSKG